MLTEQKVKVLSVNISEKKGTVKVPAKSISFNGLGVIGDAHAGRWHRQVSLLGTESIERFKESAKRDINYGDFAENITTQGIELVQTKPGDRFVGHSVELEVTQIGKSCHGDGCNIFKEVGNCVMPKEGIFCKVIKQGTLKAGDELMFFPKIYRVQIITLSDRASQGVYKDKSGPELVRITKEFFEGLNWQHNIEHIVIPDDEEQLRLYLSKAKEEDYDLLITTGGTGIGPRDMTPEVVKPMIDKEIPGIMEMIRVKYGADKPNALLSRSIAGLMGNTFVYTLPGSVNAVKEYMEEITKTLQHLFLMKMGVDTHSH